MCDEAQHIFGNEEGDDYCGDGKYYWYRIEWFFSHGNTEFTENIFSKIPVFSVFRNSVIIYEMQMLIYP